MRVIEFRVPLPISLEEYPIAQLYNVAKKSLEDQITSISHKSPDNYRYVVNEPYEDPDGNKGQYSEKLLTIMGKFPKWITSLVNKDWFTIIEDSWNSFPTFKTTYRSNFVKQIRIEFHTNHVTGQIAPDGKVVPSVDDDIEKLKEIVYIDIVNDKADGYDLTKLHSQRKGWKGIDKDWLNDSSYDIITAYKIFVLDLPVLPGFCQSKVEDWVCAAVQSELCNFHQKIISTVDEWCGYDITRIRELEATCAHLLENLGGCQTLTCSAGKESLDQLEVPKGRIKEEYMQNVSELLDGNHVKIMEEFERQHKKLNPPLQLLPQTTTTPPLNTNKIEKVIRPKTRFEWVILAAVYLSAGRWRIADVERMTSIFVALNTGERQSDGVRDFDHKDLPPQKTFRRIGTPLSKYMKLDSETEKPQGALIWKLSNSWVSNSWSKRLMVVENYKLKYYNGTTKEPEEEPKFIIDLRECTVRFTIKAEELLGRPFGIVINNSGKWIRPLILSTESINDSKSMVLQLQGYIDHIALRNSNSPQSSSCNSPISPRTTSKMDLHHNSAKSLALDRELRWELRISRVGLETISGNLDIIRLLEVILSLQQELLSKEERSNKERDASFLLCAPEIMSPSNHKWRSMKGYQFNGGWSALPIHNDITFKDAGLISGCLRLWRSEPIICTIVLFIWLVAYLWNYLRSFLLSRFGYFLILCVVMLEFFILPQISIMIKRNNKDGIPMIDTKCEHRNQPWWRTGLISGILFPVVLGVHFALEMENELQSGDVNELKTDKRDYVATVMNASSQMELNELKTRFLGFIPFDGDQTHVKGKNELLRLSEILLQSRGLCGHGYGLISHLYPLRDSSGIHNEITLGTHDWLAYSLPQNSGDVSRMVYITRPNSRCQWVVYVVSGLKSNKWSSWWRLNRSINQVVELTRFTDAINLLRKK